MPPKRKLETVPSPEKDSNESKEEKKKRKEEERAKAKAWAEERRKKRLSIATSTADDATNNTADTKDNAAAKKSMRLTTTNENANIMSPSLKKRVAAKSPKKKKKEEEIKRNIMVSPQVVHNTSTNTASSSSGSSTKNDKNDSDEESNTSLSRKPKPTKRRKISKEEEHLKIIHPKEQHENLQNLDEALKFSYASAASTERAKTISVASPKLQKHELPLRNMISSPPASTKSRRKSSTTAQGKSNSPVKTLASTALKKGHDVTSPIAVSASSRRTSLKPIPNQTEISASVVTNQEVPRIPSPEREDLFEEEAVAAAGKVRSLSFKMMILAFVLVLVIIGIVLKKIQKADLTDMTTKSILKDCPMSIPTSLDNCFQNHGFEPKKRSVMVEYVAENGTEAVKESFVTVPLASVNCSNPKPCPAHGRCEGGLLLDCLNDSSLMWKVNGDETMNATTVVVDRPFYIPNEKNNTCILSPEALHGIQSFHSTLVKLTVEQVCSSIFGLGMKCSISDADVVKGNDDGITVAFDLLSVARLANISFQENVDHVVHVLLESIGEFSNVTSSVVSSKAKDDKEFIGLATDYIENQLRVPFSCWLRNVIWKFMSGMAYFMCIMMGSILNIVCGIFSSNPIPAFVTTVVMVVFIWIRKTRERNIQVRKRVVEIQQMAYDKLMLDCNEGEGYAALHLRDEISHQLYPEPCYERNLFVNHIWQKVVASVRMDNRVTKSRKTIGGKNLEWWEWVAEPARKSRRSLIGVHSKKNE